MKRDTKYFIDSAIVTTGNYILHYFFDKDNFEENKYIYNDSRYINYTGLYVGNHIENALEQKPGSLYFDGQSKLNINLNNFYTNEFTFILNYEKTTSENGVLFSTLNTGPLGQYYGFNAVVNDYNDLLIQYYDISGNLQYFALDAKLDTKGILILKGISQTFTAMYYNVASDTFTSQSFTINKDKLINVTGDITLASGKYSKINNYKGYIQDFVFINKNLVESQVNSMMDQFCTSLKSNYNFKKNTETYAYTNFPPNVTAIFDSYKYLTGTFGSLGDNFLENTGVISGSITGYDYSLDLTGIVSYNIINNENFNSIKDSVIKVEVLNSNNVLALLNDGKITGWGNNESGILYGKIDYAGDWSGSLVGKLTSIKDIKCKNNACLALINGGKVTGWGNNEFGKIYGTNKYNNASNIFTGLLTSTPLYSLAGITGIELGEDHAVFLKNNNTLIAWGNNTSGQVAGINDRYSPFPLKLRIKEIYSNLSIYSGLYLNYTGMVNGKPSYKLIDDPRKYNINLYYDNESGNWKFDYNSGQNTILVRDLENQLDPILKSSMPYENKDLPFTLNVTNSNNTTLNGNYFISNSAPGTYFHEDYGKNIIVNGNEIGIINYYNIKRNINDNNYWTVYNGSDVTGYKNTSNLENKIPTTNWSPIPRFGYTNQLLVKTIYVNFDPIYNSSENGIFTGLWSETPVFKLSGVKKISVGDDFNLALFKNSGITGWGDNTWNQATSGNFLNSVLDIAAGSNHSLAILNENNTLTGWGYDYNGVSISLALNLTGIKSIDATKNTSIYLDNNNYLQGFGIDEISPNINDTRLYNASESGVFVKHVTGTQDSNIVTGNVYFNFNIYKEKPYYKTQDITEVITGYELRGIFTGVTGYKTGFLKTIPDYTTQGFPIYGITGYTGIRSGLVVTGKNTGVIDTIEILTLDLIKSGFSSGIYDPEKTGNYIYDFVYTSNLTNIKGVETLYLDSGNLSSVSKQLFNRSMGYKAVKNTSINYTKQNFKKKKVNYLNSMGVDNVIINMELDGDDIVEIYQFIIIDDYNIDLKMPAQLMKTTDAFRVPNTGARYLIESNGIGQFLNFDYTSEGTLISFSGNYDFSDKIYASFIRFDQNFIEYTGQENERLIPKDFVYLNGQKLISGIHYNFDNSILENLNSIRYDANAIYRYESGDAGTLNSVFDPELFALDDTVQIYYEGNVDGESFIFSNSGIIKSENEEVQHVWINLSSEDPLDSGSYNIDCNSIIVLNSDSDYIEIGDNAIIRDYDSKIYFNTEEINITGAIHTAKSFIQYNTYTGYSNYYNLNKSRFSKNTTMAWVNGVRLHNEEHIDSSVNDPFMVPNFYDKTSNIIYNNTEDFMNI
jgi:alpha-tubulin suppressor-like RCC1 family protein